MNRVIRNLREYGIVIIGNFILAFGVAGFVIPNNILTGGVAGIAVALKPLLHVSPQLIINVLTIVLFLVGSVLLGKSFAMKTLLSTICYPLFLNLLSAWVPYLHLSNDVFMSVIYSGIFMGVGVGLIFYTGASSGGMDIPPLILHKYTGLPLAGLVLVVDGLTVLLGMMVYGLNAALIGILSVFVSSFMIDKTMMLGSQKTKNVLIISSHYEDIVKMIDEKLERGATLLEGVGCYTGEARPVIMVCIAKKQYLDLTHHVAQLDPCAFMIIQDADEVRGYGFSFMTQDFPS